MAGRFFCNQMAPSEPPEITGLLKAWRNADQASFERLIPLVYNELGRLARGTGR